MALVDLVLKEMPRQQSDDFNTVRVGMYAHAREDTPFSAATLILRWSAPLELVRAEPGERIWMLDGFIRDPYELNASLEDGEGLWTCAAFPKQWPVADRPGLLLGVLRFEGEPGAAARVALVPQIGEGGEGLETVVFGTDAGAQKITGRIGAVDVRIPDDIDSVPAVGGMIRARRHGRRIRVEMTFSQDVELALSDDSLGRLQTAIDKGIWELELTRDDFRKRI